MRNRCAGLVAEEIEHHAFAQFLVNEHGEKFFFPDGLGNAARTFAALFIDAGINAATSMQQPGNQRIVDAAIDGTDRQVLHDGGGASQLPATEMRADKKAAFFRVEVMAAFQRDIAFVDQLVDLEKFGNDTPHIPPCLPADAAAFCS